MTKDAPDKTVSELYEEGIVDDDYLERAGQDIADMQRAIVELKDLIDLTERLLGDELTVAEFVKEGKGIADKHQDENGQSALDRLLKQ